jgi:hypothetical protein
LTEGKAWKNSTGVRNDVCGDDEAKDVGDGGPRAEGDMNEWDVGGGLDTFDDANALWVMGGDDSPPSECREFRIVHVLSKEVDVGERGIAKVEGSSLELPWRCALWCSPTSLRPATIAFGL